MSAANRSRRPSSSAAPPLRTALLALAAVVVSIHAGGPLGGPLASAAVAEKAPVSRVQDETRARRTGPQRDGAQRDGAAQAELTVEERVARLETALEQLRVELANGLDPLRVQIADRGQDLRAMQTRLSALEEQLALASERLADLGQRLEQLIAAGSGGATTAPSTTAPMPPPGGQVGVAGPRATSADATASTPSDARQLYSRAYTDFLRENYELAIAGFEEFLQRFADDPQADNALYWIGECRLAGGDARGAIAAFREVANRYPDGDAVPDAMFKVALALRELGDDAGAAGQMRRLIRGHPTSAPARLACTQLLRMEEELPPECDAASR